MRPAGLAVLIGLCAAGPASGQAARAAVVPDTVTVGDIFRAAVRVTVPAGATVTFPDTLAVPQDVEAAARRELSVDSVAGGERTWTAVYPLAAWKPGPVGLPPVRIRIELPDGGRVADVEFPAVAVRSVLPADTAGIEPKPPKDVMGPSRLLWPLALGLAALAALLAWLFWFLARRRPRPLAFAVVEPRATALAELDRIREQRILEREGAKPFHSAVTGVLRWYVAALDRDWSLDLTTPELESAMDGEVTGNGVPNADRPETADRLLHLLRRADLVKFAAVRPSRPESETLLAESRDWVERFRRVEAGAGQAVE